jgi:HK97 family phage major capsid protein
MPKTLEQLQTENEELQKQLVTLTVQAEARTDEATRQQIAVELANQHEAEAIKFQQAFDADVAERVQRILEQRIGPGIASALSGIRIQARPVFPENVLRAGNLSKADRQLVDVICHKRPYEAKALDATTAYSGAEWVPTGLAGQLYELLMLDSLVRQTVEVITMPSDPYKVPGYSTIPRVDFLAANTAVTSPAGPATATAATLAGKKLITEVDIGTEAEENMIIPVVAQIKQMIATAIASSEEGTILWGDASSLTAANNLNHDIVSNDYRVAFTGLAKTIAAGTATWFIAYGTDWPTSLRAGRAAMGKYGVKPLDLVYVVPTYVYNKLVGAAGFLTYDKVGAMASTLTGVLPNARPGLLQYGLFDGSIVIVSEQIPKTNNAFVVHTTAGDNTYYNAVMYNRRRVLLGERRNLTIKMIYWPPKDQDILVATEIVDLALPDGGTSGAYCGIKAGA